MTKEEVLKEIDKIDFSGGGVREIVIKSVLGRICRTVSKFIKEGDEKFYFLPEDHKEIGNFIDKDGKITNHKGEECIGHPLKVNIKDCRDVINEDAKRGDLIRIVRSFCLNKDYTISREDIPEMVDKIINRIN